MVNMRIRPPGLRSSAYPKPAITVLRIASINLYQKEQSARGYAHRWTDDDDDDDDDYDVELFVQDGISLY